MTDVFTKRKRSWLMSRISGKNTKPEIIVRKILYNLGFRYRVHYKKLPGSPDIVLPKYRKVIFVHGCFWHGHTACRKAALPKTNDRFWHAKITSNKKRDKKTSRRLNVLGWRTLTIWECQLKSKEKIASKLEKYLLKG